LVQLCRYKPPHFHAERPGDWELRIYFLRDPGEMIEKKWGEQPKPAELRKLLSLAEKHRVDLLAEWQRKVCVREPGPER
jgi:hypothetical protein